MQRSLLKTRIIFFTFCLIFISTLSFAQSQPQLIATGFLQPEGPIWVDSLGLLFSDIKGNTIYQWSPSSGTATQYIKPSDSSNGLTLDNQGSLVICQMGQRRVVRRESDGTITPLASTYKGKKFNCPNDVVVKSDNSIFFTDPDFNIPIGQKAELSFRGIYRISPFGDVQLLDSTFDKPNGICFSPDEKKLYVNESPKGKIYVWDVENDSIITNKKLLYTIPTQGYADGMKTDLSGNIYCTGPTGVWVISSNGVYLNKIIVPGSPSNCNWGDADRKTLYITGGNSLYKVRPELTDIENSKKKDQTINEFKLQNNFPNPFNPTTTIGFGIPEKGNVRLSILNILGEQIRVLLNDEREAGYHSIDFSAGGESDFGGNASSLPSGVYFYQLQAGSFIETKKLMLLK